MEIKVIRGPTTREELQRVAKEGFGDVVKTVTDVAQEIMAIGGELHADEEALLMEQCGSKREHVWGINLYPGKSGDDFIEFDSMINIKPAHGNRSRGVENPETRKKIRQIVQKLVIG